MQTKGINVQDQGARNRAQKVQGKATRLETYNSKMQEVKAGSQSWKSKVQDIWLLQTCNGYMYLKIQCFC